MLNSGDRINKYQILGEIGQGGEAVIYRALDTFSGKEVALKVIHEQRGKYNPEINHLFLREGEILSGINHDGIIRIYESNVMKEGNRELFYHAMELVNAPTLDKHIEGNTLDWRESVRILRAIAEVMVILHGRKDSQGEEDPVLHRDLKPSNIFLINSGDTNTPAQVKIFDFGLAKRELERTITAPDAFRGTVRYAAPELLKVGGKASTASDVYAVGRILEDMTGEKPSEEIPRWVIDLKNLMCEYSPKNRPSAMEVVEIIDEQLEVGTRIFAPLTKLVSLRNKVKIRKWRTAIRAVSVAMIVLILCVFGYLLYEYFKPGPKIIGETPRDKLKDVFAIGVSDNYAYIANAADGLKVINISNPKKPVILEEVNVKTEGFAQNITINGNRAYISDGHEGICIIDISNPLNPEVIKQFDTDVIDESNVGATTYDVTISGDLAYIADEWKGIKVLDLSDPQNPIIIGSYDTESYAYAVKLKDNYAFVPDGSNGLNIIDVSDPQNMKLVGIAPSQRAKDVAISGNYAFLADGESGLAVIDISNPSDPKHVLGGSIDSEGESIDIELADGRVYIADKKGGLMIVDVIDPRKPFLVRRIRTRDIVYDVAISGNYAYMAVLNEGLKVVRLQ